MSLPALDLTDLAGLQKARRALRREPGFGVFPFLDQQQEGMARWREWVQREGARALLEGNFPPAPRGIRALPPTLSDAMSIREQVERQISPVVRLPVRRPDTGEVEQMLLSGDDPIPAPFELALPRHLDIIAEALRRMDRDIADSPFFRARAQAVVAALPPPFRAEFGGILEALDRGMLTPDALEGWLERLRQARGLPEAAAP